MIHDHWGVKNPNYRHGMRGTRFYTTWKHINSRCNSTRNQDFRHYGGRGIKNHWKDFLLFKQEMFDSYCKHVAKFGEKNTTIDRINNQGNYCRDNCRWATRAIQSRNTRRTNIIEYRGETRCLADWAKHLGMKRATLSNRINIYKWPIDKALSTMVK